MKKFTLKEESGFTLVELMVVVAIIGILSAVAVPNFKKYQAKSKQSDAKLQLAALYTAETGAVADYNTYVTCIGVVGFEQAGKGYYFVGFSAGIANATITNCTAGAAVTPAAANAPMAAGAYQVAPLVMQTVNGSFPAAMTGAVAPTQTAFTAVATGNISASVAADIWTVNQAKVVTNTTPGF